MILFYSALMIFFSFELKALTLNSGKEKLDPLVIKKLSKTLEWRNLLHVQKSILGDQLIVIDSNFYLSPEEDFSLEKELAMSVRRLKHEAYSAIAPRKSFQCIYPARTHFIFEKLALPVERKNCDDLLYWKKSLQVDKVSLVYLLPDTGSISTLFGELYLKLVVSGTAKEDYLVGFSSTSIDQNFPFRSYWKALWKGRRGQISLSPFSIVKKTIPFVGRRDVWEYELSLVPKEIDQILNSLWEIYRENAISFKFTHGTGPYYLSRLIQIGAGEDRLTAGINNVSTPAEVLKALSKKNIGVSERRWISKVQFFPSAFRKAYAEDISIKGPDEQAVVELTTGEIGPDSIEDVATIKKAMSRMVWKQWKLARRPQEQKQQTYDDLKTRLGEVGDFKFGNNLQSNLKKPWSPHKMHGRSSIGLGQGISTNSEHFKEVSYRFGLHDFLNSDVGFPRFSHLEVLKLRYRFFDSENTTRETGIEELALLDFTTLIPAGDKILPSWSGKLSYQRPEGMINREILSIHSSFGAGFAKETILGKWKFYAIAKGLLEFSSDFPEGNFRLGTIAKVGVLGAPKNLYKFNLELTNLFDVNSQMGYQLLNIGSLSHSFHLGRRMDLRLKMATFRPMDQAFDDYSESTLSGILYY